MPVAPVWARIVNRNSARLLRSEVAGYLPANAGERWKQWPHIVE